MLSILLFPIHLAFGLFIELLWLPFVLVRLVLKVLVALVLAPIFLLLAPIIVIVGALTFSLAVLTPLIPFMLVAWLVWALVHVCRPRLV